MIAVILLFDFPILPVNAAQASKGITMNGKIARIPELGVWFVPEYVNVFPAETKWVIASNANQDSTHPFPANVNVILNHLWVHLPWDNPFRTAADLTTLENRLKTEVNPAKFWGIIFISEEHNRDSVAFNDDVNVVWFGETLLGYPLYQAQVPGATVDQWKDEMFLRMTRGFYNYYHQFTKVGQTMPYPSFQARSYVDYQAFYYGTPAFNFIRQHYDFVVTYAYTTNLGKTQDNGVFKRADGEADIADYFQKIDTYFPNQQKIWILTRIWDVSPTNTNKAYWTPEAVALEMKNALDRNMIITYQYDGDPSLESMWALMQKAIALYNSNATYTEEYTYGENMLTGYIGNTYGWVKVIS